MEAAAGLMKLSEYEEPFGESAETAAYEGEETRTMQQDDEETDPEAAAAASALLGISRPTKRQRTSGGSRRHRKRLPKHRTIRKHSGGQKTLTQVLKELTLGI